MERPKLEAETTQPKELPLSMPRDLKFRVRFENLIEEGLEIVIQTATRAPGLASIVAKHLIVPLISFSAFEPREWRVGKKEKTSK